jgi:hypothetical protein
MHTRLAVLVTLLLARLMAGIASRVQRLRAEPDRGSHATEYAIGIGASAAAVLALYAAFRTGLTGIIQKWIFG